MSTYCFDIDGTICDTPNANYGESIPNINRIKKINSLYFSGNTIILFTARGSTTGIDWSDLTSKQLDSWGVNYHKLYFGKPFADFYIDDKGISDGEFFA